MEKIHNSSSSYSMKVGGGLPFLVRACKFRIHGAMVLNPLAPGEVVHAGTPLEYSLADNTAKFLKVWEVKSATASTPEEGSTTIVLKKTAISPRLAAGTVIMKMPSTLAGTGKSVAVGAVTETEDGYSIVVTAADFDSVSEGDLIVEAASAGASAKIYCTPNLFSVEDTVGGTEYALVDIPYGFIHAYRNTINPIPDVVMAALTDGIVPVWEMFNETNE